jgi:hypothetical protein
VIDSIVPSACLRSKRSAVQICAGVPPLLRKSTTSVSGLLVDTPSDPLPGRGSVLVYSTSIKRSPLPASARRSA